jgi:hypothetical protein
MRKITLVYFLWAILCVSGSLAAEQKNRYELYFRNQCNYDLWIAVAHIRNDGEFRIEEGFYAAETPYLASPMEPPGIPVAPETDGTDIWIYAETEDGRIFWEGKPGDPRSKQLDFWVVDKQMNKHVLFFTPTMNLEKTSSKTFWSLYLTCDGF